MTAARIKLTESIYMWQSKYVRSPINEAVFCYIIPATSTDETLWMETIICHYN